MDKTEFKTAISKEELNLLPIFDHHGRYQFIETLDQARPAIQELKKSRVLGFDTETRPSFTRGEFHHVALLQLANHECCYLFRLNKMPLTAELTAILEDESILKVGVAIRDDVIGLNKLCPFKASGFVDLGVITATSRDTLGLRALTGIYLGQRLSKASKVTNWERDPLTEPQARYAANDAFAGLLIYEKMMEGK